MISATDFGRHWILRSDCRTITGTNLLSGNTMAIRPFLHKNPVIADSAYVDESAVVIGEVTLGENASIWPLVVARGDYQAIVIGDNTNIQDGTVIHIASSNEYVPGGLPCVVGEKVTVGHKVMLHACTVGNNCLIGMSSTILDGAVIEDNVMVGAGSLVPMGKRLESGYLYVGSPVRQVRKLADREKFYIEYSWKHYIESKNNFLKSLK
jgi:carbonic anhydrase/acetyltransferase-like protein (isoleucine patch superfamily)